MPVKAVKWIAVAVVGTLVVLTLAAAAGSRTEPLRRLGALMAVDAEGRLRGVVTLEQVSRALQARLAPS